MFTHLYYCYATFTVGENFHLIYTFSLYQLAVSSLFVLTFIWYKFLTIWRIGRAWALVDGFETVENMNRCINNNYCFEMFWRSWHRSFNQWLIRYIFIPLGGSKMKHINMWVVFTFVAVWHDQNINLIVWAWGICLALLPEILVKKYFNQKKFNDIWQKYWFKYLTGLLGAFYITLMVFANLVGFAIGKNGVEKLIAIITGGIWQYCVILLVLTPVAVFMFWIRDQENLKQHR